MITEENINMIDIKPTPRYYGIPHDTWREGQYEAVLWMLDNANPVKILESPTGSGKTGMATALSKEHALMSLCRTKLLQEANYDNTYNWDTLFGRSNYKCVHPDVDYDVKADQCLYSSQGMHKCPVAKECPYLIKKGIARDSGKTSLNYAYFLTARWPREDIHKVLVLDEAHLLSDITLDFTGIIIHEKTREEWGLPVIPRIDGNGGQPLLVSVSSYKSPHDIARAWLNDVRACLDRTRVTLSVNIVLASESTRKKLRRCESLLRSVEATLFALSDERSWYIRSGTGIAYYRGKQIPGFIARPLTARYHFPKLFLNHNNVVMMSATVGDDETYATELGVESHDFRRIPSPWTPDMRPVRILDAPRMSWKSKDMDYEHQADVIADAIKEHPDDWKGVIHVTRIKEASILANRLAQRGLYGRVWTPPKGGTNQQMRAWEDHKKMHPRKGSIAVAWAWTEGVDLYDERICIIAKTPFPNIGDPYEKARMGFDAKFFLQRTAWSLEQASGRTRRGEREHYDVDGQVNGLVAIADGNYSRVKKYFSESFKESLVEG